MYRLIDRQPDFIIIDKAPGVAVHRDQEAQGLLDVLRADLGCDSLHLVHRLDAITSGLMVLATHRDAARTLSQAFHDHQVDKFYLALSDRKPARKQGWVTGDMDRGRRGSWRLLPTRVNPAITRFFSVSVEPGVRAFLLRPRTGRTHQLRVALKSLGSPLLGDPLYHAADAANAAADRAYLHHYAFAFELGGRRWRYVQPPTTGVHFLAAPFVAALGRFDDPWALDWPESFLTR